MLLVLQRMLTFKLKAVEAGGDLASIVLVMDV